MFKYMKVEPVDVPIVGCEIYKYEKTLTISSSYTGDITNGNLNIAQSYYNKTESDNCILLGIKDDDLKEKHYFSVSLKQAEEIIKTLQSMVNVIKGK